MAFDPISVGQFRESCDRGAATDVRKHIEVRRPVTLHELTVEKVDARLAPGSKNAK